MLLEIFGISAVLVFATVGICMGIAVEVPVEEGVSSCRHCMYAGVISCGYEEVMELIRVLCVVALWIL